MNRSTFAGLTFALGFGLFAPAGPGFAQCTDGDIDGYFAEPSCGTPLDCNDADPFVHPFASESCDGFDNDCDTETDEDPSCALTCPPFATGIEVLLSDLIDASGMPVVAWTRDATGVVWEDGFANAERIDMAFLDPTGQPTGPPVVVADGPGFVRGPALVWTGSEYGLAWWDTANGTPTVRFVRLDDTGHPSGTVQRVSVADGARWPQVLWTGSEFVVVWIRDDGAVAELRLARLDRFGEPNGEPRVIVDAQPPSSLSSLLAQWTGDSVALTWTADTDAGEVKRFLRVSPAGDAAAPPVALGAGRTTDLVWIGDAYRLVGTDGTAGNRLVLQHVAADGTFQRADSTITSNAAGPIASAAIAWTGGELAIVWVESHGGVSELRLGRFGPAGAPIGAPFVVTAPPSVPRQPAVAFTGAALQVAWLDTRAGQAAIRARYVTCGCFDGDGDGATSCEDCDDGNATVYPDAPQLCDGINNDCLDPSWPAIANEADGDGDGFRACAECDDTRSIVFPGAPEVCDGIQNDCDAPDWPNNPDDVPIDDDGDGVRICADCDDTNASVFPGAPEICDGVNNDCFDTDWPTPPPADRDLDADGFVACAECDDTDPATFPGAPEICDGVQNDCAAPDWPDDPDGDIDGDGVDVCTDCDNTDARTFPGAEQICDGINNDCLDPDWPAVPVAEIDGDGDGSIGCADCDDLRDDVFPGAPDRCDGVNNDCLDPAWPDLVELVDRDGDGFAPCTGDCDDTDPEIGPNAPDVCDGVDNDCDGTTDDQPACPTGCNAGDLLEEKRWTSFFWNTRELDAVWNGEVFGVATREVFDLPDRIAFLRFDRDGNQLGDDVIIVTDRSAGGPSIVWTGTEFGVAWSERNSSNRVVLARFDGDGVPLGDPVTVADTVNSPSAPGFAWNGSRYAVAWRNSSRQIVFQLADATGTPVIDPVLLSGRGESQPTVIWTGSEHAVFWFDERALPAILLARLDAEGAPIGESRTVETFEGRAIGFDLVWTGAGFSAAWVDPLAPTTVAFARLNPAGARVGDATIIEAANRAAVTRLTWTGFEHVLQWEDEDRRRIWMTRLDAVGGMVSAPFVVIEGDNLVPLWTGTEYQLIFAARRNSFPFNRANVFGQRLLCACPDRDGDGSGVCVDCRDEDHLVFPGAFERCNRIDDDCDDEVDEGLAGAVCDLEDGRIVLGFARPTTLAWHVEQGFDAWNVYRGDLTVLRGGGDHTQQPDSNAVAARFCGHADPALDDPFVPPTGAGAFYLVTGVGTQGEGDLGLDGGGTQRPHAHPCPQ